MARPLGDFSRALLIAAEAGPATVRELCARAQVGFDIGIKTASRMLHRGDLQVLDVAPSSGRGRPPMVLALPAASKPGLDLASAIVSWHTGEHHVPPVRSDLGASCAPSAPGLWQTPADASER